MSPEPRELQKMTERDATAALSNTLIEFRLQNIDRELNEIAAANYAVRIDRLEQEAKRRDKSIGYIWVAVLSTIGTIVAGLVIWFATAQAGEGAEVSAIFSAGFRKALSVVLKI